MFDLFLWQVFVLKDGKSVPIITGVISMPVSEGMVVVWGHWGQAGSFKVISQRTSFKKHAENNDDRIWDHSGSELEWPEIELSLFIELLSACDLSDCSWRKELLHFFVCLVMLKNCLHILVFTSSTQHSMTGLIKSCLRIIETLLFFPLSACLSFTLHVVPLCHYMYNYNLLKTTINDQPFFFPVWWIFSSNFEYVSVLHVLIYLVSDATFNLYDPLPSCFGCKRREYFIALYGGRVLKQIVVQ